METDVFLIELYGYIARFLRKDIFQKRSGFFGQNHGRFKTRFYGRIATTHQNISVRSDKNDIFGVNIHAHAVHNRAQFVIGRSKKAAGNTSQQYRRGHRQTGRLFAHGRTLRVFIAVDAHKIVFTILVIEKYLQIFVIDLECQRLFGQLAQGIEQNFRRHGKQAFSFCLDQTDSCGHCRFLIRSRYRQFISFQSKKEIIENRHRVFGINHSSHGLQMRK